MRYTLAVLGLSAAFTLTASALGQTDEPSRDGDRLVYPEGAAIPRCLTPIEREFRDTHPPGGLAGATPPPTGTVRCPGEYEPMEGVLIAWEGSSSWLSILAQIGRRVTNEGAARLYVVVDDGFEQTSASSSLAAAGALMSRVSILVRTTDTIWIRDYGPRYIYEGNCRAIIDHDYNRPRPSDDVLPIYFAAYKNHAIYQLPLIHGGGNFHLSSLGDSPFGPAWSYVTRLVDNENPSYSETQIHDLWGSYQNVDTTFFTPFPTTVDSTQHIDMWVQVIDDRAVVVSDWPNNVGSTQDQICDAAAATLAARGYTVYRTPARLVGGVHYTYTNVVMCNDLVIIPSYTNGSVSPHNATALSVWQQACPTRTIVQLNGESIVSSAGVFHCIVMHVPVPLGGANPTAFLRSPRGGEALTPGQSFDIRWISDDDVAVTSVDLLLSIDGGARYDRVIAAATAPDGVQIWIVPNLATSRARVRVVVRDADGHSGSDESPADFAISGALRIGDANCDGFVNNFDIDAFVLALSAPGAYAAQYPACPIAGCDANGDGGTDNFDIDAFVSLLTGG